MISLRVPAAGVLVALAALSTLAGCASRGKPYQGPSTVEERLERGSKLLAAKDYPSAIREFEGVLAVEPDNLRAHLGLGLTYLHTTYYEGAAGQFSRALSIDENSAEAHYGMGAVKFQQGDLAGAEPHFARAIEIYPDYALAHYSLGVIWERKGDDVRAQEYYEQAVLADPGLREAQFNLGLLYARTSQLNDAISALVEVRALAPDSAPTRLALAELYRKTGQNSASLAELNVAEELAPRDPRVYQQKGLTLLASDMLEEAESSLKKALSSEPDHYGSLLGLAEVQFRMRDLRASELTLRHAIDIDPTSALAKFKLGRALSALGRDAEAEETLKEALNLSSDQQMIQAVNALLDELEARPSQEGPDAQ